jgi:DNA-binding transcriptional ArsR family regulator
VFKTPADPTRRSICREGEQTVWMLTRHARISQPAVSKHLAALKSAGLVRDRREGRETHYRADPKGLAPLIDWMNLYVSFWRARFDQLEDLLSLTDTPPADIPPGLCARFTAAEDRRGRGKSRN